MAESWDIYDRNRIKTGRTIERGNKLESGDYRLVIHVCIFNSKGEMLVQQRQPWKKGWPNMWDFSVGGCVVAGEDSNTSAEREVFEELGYKLDLSEERPYLTIDFENGFNDFFIVKRDIDINSLTLQEGEVKDAKWASREDILKMLDKGKFVPYYSSFINLIFDIKESRGIHRK